MSLDERFNTAAERVKNLTKKPTDQELLDLYALFKQGSIGDNQTSKPGFLDMKGKYKWEAWNKLKGKPQDEAKEEYIKMVEVLFSKTDMTLDEDFRKAAETVKKLKQRPNEDEMLAIYALYKQAEFGDCNVPKPGLLDFTGKVKWDAWNSKKGLSRDSAKEQYIDKSNELVKKYGVN